MSSLEDELLEDLYAWVDQIPLTRPKKNIHRDFSDGVLVAEIVKHYCPRIVELHNYVSTCRTDLKLTNWSLLNRKVFKKLGFELTDDVMQNIVHSKPMAIEQFLMLLRRKIDRHLYETQRKEKPTGQTLHKNDQPEADQDLLIEKIQSSHYQENSKSNKTQSKPDMARQHPVPPIGTGPRPGFGGANKSYMNQYNKGEYVSKLAVEEKEQELLAKDETIQILQAKVRRLEHLLHLKDIRIDDLQSRLDRMGMELRPTQKYKK